MAKKKATKGSRPKASEVAEPAQWEAYEGWTPGRQEPGDYVRISSHGDLYLSADLMAARPDVKRVMLHVSLRHTRLRLTPVQEIALGSLAVSGRSGGPGRVSSVRAMRQWALVPSERTQYPAMWVDGAILIDLTAGSRRPCGDQGGAKRHRKAKGSTKTPAGPIQVECAVCGKVVSGVREGDAIRPSAHDDEDGDPCPGRDFDGLLVD